MSELVCTKCNFLVEEGKVCPNCQNTSFSKEWLGYVTVLDPVNSEIAKRLGITKPGKYALRVRS